jgi:hypothetical protein
MTHRNADDLSDAIDSWLSREGSVRPTHLAEVVEALSDALPAVADDYARERVRRRLAGFNPNPKSAQQVLVERAVDQIELIQRRLTGEEYVPWPAVARLRPQSAVAPIKVGPRFCGVAAVDAVVSRSAWYVTVGQTVAPGSSRRLGSSAEGRTTETPSSATP